ncbi:MAG: hypothetical protein ACK5IB_03355 [Qingshengfaniella sp.]
MKIWLGVALLLAALAAAGWIQRDRLAAIWAPHPLSDAAMDHLYATPRAPLTPPVSVFHMGHSLVGVDMPAMLAQIAGPDHRHASQLGWGTSLKQHWAGPAEIAGFDEMNARLTYRDAHEALASGAYTALVLTEMVEIRDAIRYHDTARYMAQWLQAAVAGNPDIQLYLYETWHQLDDPEGWHNRIARDLGLYWENGVLRPALARMDPPRPVYLIPGGQVMAAFAKALDEQGGFPGLYDRTDLFARTADGSQDMIHFNEWGAYLMALTHYAVIYAADPRGRPTHVTQADGSPMRPLPEGAAALMQQVVWDVVSTTPKTGLGPTDGAL